MNIIKAQSALETYIAANIPVFLWGAPGVGKSDMIRAACANQARHLVDERLSTMESLDLRGLPFIDAAKVNWSVPAMIAKLRAFNGEPTALFLDEMNAASSSMQAASFGLVLDRFVGEHALPANCVIIAAGNRQSDRASAQRMPSALANRFAHLDVEPDADAWRAWANGPGNMAPALSAFIAFRPALLHKMEGADLRAFPSPRSWSQVSKVIDAPADIRQTVIAGLVGEAVAGELEAFLRVWKRIPSIDAIITDPNGADVPAMSEPALMYAVCSALARKATRANFKAVLTYAARLPDDFTVLLATDAIRRDRDLCETRAYVDFAADHADVTI